ncbi:xylose isomerase domain-containing protein TIM barrel [Janibacter hoylei PVAS-1]|uniref:Sugar phosphate isomerase/epimerase n=1 Tax=Janibacter hoylei PVAS-1 TaxID=1210046 RepID=K1E272_9MICO|nr:sugar phosphate isomerase/epimerase [Janibacter hoylei]EKA62739.1 xylose isomerase domain-containing protein TIM barrel [Janibacter hoylei PVAS-1]RWU84818.1 sugar phosphate isomerase/epimerase [Janibacter hoylei PVAS-1]
MPDHARPIPVGLSTASVYPEGAAAAFETAARLGYDGVEVMVWSDPVSQNAGALLALAEHHGVDIVSIHAPTLLLTQRVMSADPWGKVDASIELAQEVGAPTVVLHPPFRWQKEYARTFADGVAEREDDTGIVLAVENMFPWAAGGRQVQAYLPHWDPVPQPYDHVTVDLSHTATARSDAMQMVLDLDERLAHIHLADGLLTTLKDDHLVPGRGTQPCAEVLQHVATSGFAGAVVLEVGTRKRPKEREEDLRESLDFARRHLGQLAAEPSGTSAGSA